MIWTLNLLGLFFLVLFVFGLYKFYHQEKIICRGLTTALKACREEREQLNHKKEEV